MRIWLARISNRGASLSSSPVRAPSMEAAGGAAGCGALGGNVANCRFAQEEQRLARTGGESAAGRRRERRRVVAIMEGGGGGYMYAIVGDILVIRGGAQLGFKRLKKSETRWLFLGCREGNCGDRPFVSPPRYRPPPALWNALHSPARPAMSTITRTLRYIRRIGLKGYAYQMNVRCCPSLPLLVGLRADGL